MHRVATDALQRAGLVGFSRGHFGHGLGTLGTLFIGRSAQQLLRAVVRAAASPEYPTVLGTVVGSLLLGVLAYGLLLSGTIIGSRSAPGSSSSSSSRPAS